MLSPFSQAISNIKSPFLNRRRGGDASPLALFAGGAIGVWFDPSDVANLAWRRNLLTYSEQFEVTTGGWTKELLVPVNTISTTDPFGGTTADIITDNATSGRHIAYQTFSDNFNINRTFSVYAKQNSLRYLALSIPNNSDTNCYSAIFDLQGNGAVTGTKTNGSASLSTAITPAGNGWFRCSISGVVATTGSGNFYPMIATSDRPNFTGSLQSNNIPVYSGTGQSLFIWGAQLELGTIATDYQRISDVEREVMERFSTTTMFKDAAGTSPVTTPGDPVGLRLDKSKGLVLGPELVTNGDFSIPVTTGWSAFLGASLSVDNGRLKVTSTGTNPYALYAISTVVNKWYSFTVGYDAAAHPGQLAVYPASNTGGAQLNTMSNITGSGVRSCYFMATGTTSYVHVQGITVTSGVSIFFDSISVRELPGNHASQSTIAARPTYGIEPRGGRRNLLTWSEDFSNAVWLKYNSPTIAQNDAAAPNGTLTACRVTLAYTNKSSIYQATSTNSIPARRGIYAKFGTARFLWFEATSTTPTVWFDLQNGTVSGNTSGGTPSILRVGDDGWYLCSIAVGASATNFSFGFSNASGSEVQTVGQYSWVWGAQIELGLTATPYQKVTTEYDITEAGVPTRHYVAYGGAHSMITNTIDFTATDKMSVFAGVRKLSDTAGHIVGGNGNNPGQFEILSSGWMTNASRYGAALYTNAILQIDSPANFIPPRNDVLSWNFDLAGATNVNKVGLRVNAAIQTLSTAGTPAVGNFSAYPIRLGQRDGGVLSFIGRDYGIIVVGKTVSTAEITATETWLFDKTGIFAPIITGVPTIGAS